MTDNNRGQLLYKSRMQTFNRAPCIETARPVFLICRQEKIEIPEAVLDCIAQSFQEKQNDLHKEFMEHQSKRLEKLRPKEHIISCALRTSSLSKAYQLYLDEQEVDASINKRRDLYEKLRQKLRRALGDEISRYIKTQFPTKTPHPYTTIPTSVTDRLALYRELIASEL